SRSSPSPTRWRGPWPPAAATSRAGGPCAGTWRSCGCSCSRRNSARRAACRRRSSRRAWRRLPDAHDLGAAVVAGHAHVPGLANDTGVQAHGGVVQAHAHQLRAIDLPPDLAIVQRVLPAVAEAEELAGDARLDRFARTDCDEAALLVDRALLRV